MKRDIKMTGGIPATRNSFALRDCPSNGSNASSPRAVCPVSTC